MFTGARFTGGRARQAMLTPSPPSSHVKLRDLRSNYVICVPGTRTSTFETTMSTPERTLHLRESNLRRMERDLRSPESELRALERDFA